MILYPSGETKTYAHGGMDLAKKRSVASLSKAVTGLCIAGLISDKKLTLTDKLGKLLHKHFDNHGKSADDRIPEITISQLLTHYSGFGEGDNDPAIDPALTQVVEASGVKSKQYDQMLHLTFSKPLTGNPDTIHAYSNANYLVLGAIIEAVTGQQYEDYCAKRVLEKAGVNATLDPSGKVLSSFAGWYLSPEEILKVFALYHPSKGFLSPELQNWHFSLKSKIFPDSNWSNYGFGTIVFTAPDRYFYIHDGSWTDQSGPVPNIGSLAKNFWVSVIYTQEGVGIFSVMEPIKDDESIEKLLGRLHTAYLHAFASLGKIHTYHKKGWRY